MNICIVSLNDKDMSDEQLNHLLNSAPPRSILLLEDVDAAFWARESVVDSHTRVTFSGLLNALGKIKV
jgi:chaperone BCS1